MERRTKGTGSIYFASTPQTWLFSTSIGSGAARQRVVVTRRRLCHLLQEVTRREMWPQAPKPTTPRQQAMRRARTLKNHTGREWLEYVSGHPNCEYCGRSVGTDPIKEHRTPVSRGGSNGLDNLAVSCYTCNSLKGNQTEDEFRAWLASGGLAEVLSMPTGLGSRGNFWAKRVELTDAFIAQGYEFFEACRLAAETQRGNRAS